MLIRAVLVHRALLTKTYHQGRFSPRNPKKYVGNPDEIFFRSSWERRVMIFFDTNPMILQWSSETTVIPYISPVDSCPHRYFVDFSVMFKTKTGEIKKALVEVKPFKQCLPPEKKSRVTKQYITEVTTYAVNQAKWKSAEEWCKKHGYEWMILTEREINGIA